jgi:hypothetical protein
VYTQKRFHTYAMYSKLSDMVELAQWSRHEMASIPRAFGDMMYLCWRHAAMITTTETATKTCNNIHMIFCCVIH